MDITDTTSQKYALSIRILHWLMALIILSLIAVGYIMTHMVHDDPRRGQLFALHKSFGITLLGLAVLRVIARIKNGAPALPASIPKYEQILAYLSHYGFYFFFFALPLSGYLLTNSFGITVNWFGIELPKLFSVDRPRGILASDFHGYAAYTLLAVIGLHIAGAIKHYVTERLNLLKRVW